MPGTRYSHLHSVSDTDVPQKLGQRDILQEHEAGVSVIGSSGRPCRAVDNSVAATAQGDTAFIERLCELARQRPRFGYRRLHTLLRRIYCVYREALTGPWGREYPGRHIAPEPGGDDDGWDPALTTTTGAHHLGERTRTHEPMVRPVGGLEWRRTGLHRSGAASPECWVLTCG